MEMIERKGGLRKKEGRGRLFAVTLNPWVTISPQSWSDGAMMGSKVPLEVSGTFLPTSFYTQ